MWIMSHLSYWSPAIFHSVFHLSAGNKMLSVVWKNKKEWHILGSLLNLHGAHFYLYLQMCLHPILLITRLSQALRLESVMFFNISLSYPTAWWSFIRNSDLMHAFSLSILSHWEMLICLMTFLRQSNNKEVNKWLRMLYHILLLLECTI